MRQRPPQGQLPTTFVSESMWGSTFRLRSLVRAAIKLRRARALAAAALSVTDENSASGRAGSRSGSSATTGNPPASAAAACFGAATAAATKFSSAGADDDVTRMLAAGFSISEIAGEVNHIHGAHKAAAYVLTHVLHDLCQPAATQRSTAAPEPAARSDAGASPDSDAIPACASSRDAGESISAQSGRWWAAAARAEALAVLGPSNPATRKDITHRMPILKAIVLEALRRHVVSLGVVRRTGAPLRIDDTLIPSGTEIVILLQALHHSPRFWRRPMEFRPERWMTRDALRAALLNCGYARVAAAPAHDGVEGTHVPASACACPSASALPASSEQCVTQATTGNGQTHRVTSPNCWSRARASALRQTSWAADLATCLVQRAPLTTVMQTNLSPPPAMLPAAPRASGGRLHLRHHPPMRMEALAE